MDYDIQVSLCTIGKHMAVEQGLNQRGAALVQTIFSIWGIQRTGGIFGSMNKVETSEEGKEDHFRPTQKCPCFFGPKIAPAPSP